MAGAGARALALAGLAAAAAIFISDDIPYGSLVGRVVVEESGVGIAKARVVVESPKAEYRLRTDREGKFSVSRLPAGEYQVRAWSKYRRLPQYSFTVEEGRRANLLLELVPGEPFLELRVTKHAFPVDTKPTFICHGYSKSESVELRTYAVNFERLVSRRGRLAEMLGTREVSAETMALIGPETARPTGRETPEITKRDIEGVFTQEVSVEVPGPGVYVVIARVPGVTRRTWVMTTDLALITKCVGRDLLAYTTDLKGGQPAPGATVKVWAEGQLKHTGETGDDGLLRVTLPAEVRKSRSGIVVTARRGDSATFLSSDGTRYGGGAQYRVATYTDRPIYRPGHTVNFKAIARKVVGDEYQVPAETPVTVEVRDRKDTLIYRRKLETDAFGTYAGEVDLPESASTGDYSIVSRIGETETFGDFSVAAYRKPEYEVKVAPARARYVRGERIKARVEAHYYFGAPVAGAEVEYYVTRYSTQARPPVEGWGLAPSMEEGWEWESEPWQGYGDVVDYGTTRTRADGSAKLEIGTPKGEGAGDTDWRYEIQAIVTDASRRSASATGSVVVTRGRFAILMRAERSVVAPDERVKVEMLAVDYGGKPQRGVRLDLASGAEEWRGTKYRFRITERKKLRTDREGRAEFTVTPRWPGAFKVRARASDDLENEIEGWVRVWVVQPGEEAEAVHYPALSVVPDRREYHVGDTAELLINSSSVGATALVTIEGERLHDHFQVVLKEHSTVVPLPMGIDYAPNIFVSVCFVSNAEFHREQVGLKVGAKAHEVKISLKPDRKVYRPGQRASYEIRTTGPDGNPVSAQVSLGVVDEAVYALKPDSGPSLLEQFYPQRSNRVATDYSFPTIYLNGDKGGPAVTVRRRFLDTAYWRPAILTDASGRARVSLKFPDNLTTWRATAKAVTMATAVGEARSKVRVTKDLLVRLEAPRFYTQGDRSVISAIVHNYTPRRQRVEVTLSTRGLAIEGDRSDSFSVGSEGFHRIDWPIIAKSVGRARVQVIARSRGGPSDAVEITLPVLPHARRRVSHAAGAFRERAVEKIALRPETVMAASSVTVTLSPSILSAMLRSLDYLAQYPYGCTEQTMSAFLPDVVLVRTLKKLGLSRPSLEAKLPEMVREGLGRLYEYQHYDGGWGWWRFDRSDPWMTAYVTYGLLEAREAGFEVNREVLLAAERRLGREIAGAGDHATRAFVVYLLGRVLAHGMSRNDLGEVLWATDGMLTAADHGTPVSPHVLDSALARIRSARATVGSGLGGYVAQVLKKAERREWRRSRQYPGPAGEIAELQAASRSVSTPAFAYLLLAEPDPKAPRAGLLARLLWLRCYEGASLAYWTGGGDVNNVEATAVALRALIAVDPDDARLFKVVRWLMLQRTGGAWSSTRDTAFALYGLTDFLAVSRELEPEGKVMVTLNGREVKRVTLSPESIHEPATVFTIPCAKMRGGQNQIELRLEGRGNVYYGIQSVEFLAADEIPVALTGSGLSAEREYRKMTIKSDPVTEQIEIVPAEEPQTRFRPGDVIQVTLRVRSHSRRSYIMIEEPLPAGCEVAEDTEFEEWEWDRWYSDLDIRDDRIVFFARNLGSEQHMIHYTLRAQVPGRYAVMPTDIASMYDPSIRGFGQASAIEIRGR